MTHYSTGYHSYHNEAADYMLRQLLFVSIENKMEQVRNGQPTVNLSQPDPGVPREEHMLKIRDEVEAMIASVEATLQK
uniref:Uncharacterized protein n=1 Tax=Caenorhabditis japonica TaxID=281687 RepID=A0A8R1ENX7_CAEJA